MAFLCQKSWIKVLWQTFPKKYFSDGHFTCILYIVKVFYVPRLYSKLKLKTIKFAITIMGQKSIVVEAMFHAYEPFQD